MAELNIDEIELDLAQTMNTRGDKWVAAWARKHSINLCSEIRTLRDCVAELEAQNEWHPASEPPNDHRGVLVKRHEIDKLELRWHMYHEGKHYWPCSLNHHKDALDVETWYELPQPPKETNDADVNLPLE